MTFSTTGLESLPNELILQILEPSPTRSLLFLALVSQRFYNIILSILQHRLQAAATLLDHKLILECFHPSAKYSTPSLRCDYIGTDSLKEDAPLDNQSSLGISETGRLAKLAGLYSHFRPTEVESGRRRRWQYPAGDLPGYPGPSASLVENQPESGSNIQRPSEIVSLESHELFAQLCGIANIVKIGPRKGIFLSCVTIGGGVLRIWRQWLAENARFCELQSDCEISHDTQSIEEFEKRTMWIGTGRHVGVRLRVVEIGQPVTRVLCSNEDQDVSYRLEYEELVVRTSQLLLRVEESLAQQSVSTGKALVIGTW